MLMPFIVLTLLPVEPILSNVKSSQTGKDITVSWDADDNGGAPLDYYEIIQV